MKENFSEGSRSKGGRFVTQDMGHGMKEDWYIVRPGKTRKPANHVCVIVFQVCVNFFILTLIFFVNARKRLVQEKFIEFRLFEIFMLLLAPEENILKIFNILLAPVEYISEIFNLLLVPKEKMLEIFNLLLVPEEDLTFNCAVL